MKRKKDSAAPARASQRENEAKRKVEEAKSDELWPYFDNLPSHLSAHILLQLPLKSLLICRCVCKNWKIIISEPHFAKLHFEQAPTSLMIRTYDLNRVARTMHLLECEPEKFEIGSNNHVKLEAIFKLPLRDAKSFREKRDMIKNKSKRPLRAARLVSEKNNENNNKRKQGLILLATQIMIAICNPVTGEFIRLPKATTTPFKKARVRMEGQAGFGFHSKTNEYKVIKMWRKHVFEPLILEIHTLGTLLWRNVEVDPKISISNLECPTFLNDTLHWIRHGNGEQMSILCFCFESEKLQSLPSPPHNNGIHRNNNMGELRGFLYICGISLHDVTLWVMNEYGIGESWTKVYNIDTSPFSLFNNPVSRQYGLCFPIKHFKEGAANAILLFNSYNCFLYYEPEKYEFKVFQIQGTHSKFIEIISHNPSLISLKDAVKGEEKKEKISRAKRSLSVPKSKLYLKKNRLNKKRT
ncbi:F-box protein [Trifolium repens]|nr:F-box protein [Trifolium repens]